MTVLNGHPPGLTPYAVRVIGVARETPDTFTLTLDPPQKPFHFRPGQFNMLYAFGVGEAAISLSGDPSDPTQIVHTIRAVGSVTNALGRLKPGDMLGLRGPFGTSWPLDQARGKDLLIVSGGLGMAPLRPVLYEVLAHRNDYGRVTLLHGVRTPEDLAFAGELQNWSQASSIRVLLTVDRTSPDWNGRLGVVTTLFSEIDLNPDETVGFICGPDVMIRFVIREMMKRNVPENRLFVSLERNMQCAVGFCGHCQFGSQFICKDGPVLNYHRIRELFNVREV
jgi:NAD(P)H-flavin reductase